jgi:hypothetical protein
MTNRNYCFLKSNSAVALGGIPRLSNLASSVSSMKVPSNASIDTYWWSLPPVLHGPPSLPHPRILLPEHLWCSPRLFSKKKKRLRFTPNIGSVWTNRSRFGLRFGLSYRNEVRSPNRVPDLGCTVCVGLFNALVGFLCLTISGSPQNISIWCNMS